MDEAFTTGLLSKTGLATFTPIKIVFRNSGSMLVLKFRL